MKKLFAQYVVALRNRTERKKKLDALPATSTKTERTLATVLYERAHVEVEKLRRLYDAALAGR